MKRKNILFVVTSHDKKGSEPSGYFLSEVTHPHQVLTAAGYNVDFVSPKGGKAPVDGLDLTDPVNREFWENKALRYAVEHTLTPQHAAGRSYAAVFFAGGHATMWDFPDNAELAAIASKIYEEGGVVGAVCHGPAGLVNVKLSDGQYLVAGKDVAAFTNDEERAVKLADVIPFSLSDKLVERGARHQPAPDFQKQVVVSDRLVTGQNPASAAGVGEAMLQLLQKA